MSDFKEMIGRKFPNLKDDEFVEITCLIPKKVKENIEDIQKRASADKNLDLKLEELNGYFYMLGIESIELRVKMDTVTNRFALFMKGKDGN